MFSVHMSLLLWSFLHTTQVCVTFENCCLYHNFPSPLLLWFKPTQELKSRIANCDLTIMPSALVKPGAHLENKKFHFNCAKFSKNVLSVVQYLLVLPICNNKQPSHAITVTPSNCFLLKIGCSVMPDSNFCLIIGSVTFYGVLLLFLINNGAMCLFSPR